MSFLEKKELQKTEENSRIWYILSIVFLGLISLWYFFSLIHPLSAINQDLGRFIAITKDFFETWRISSLNTFSYTNPDFSFVNSHWLGGVFLTIITNLVGFSGLVIVKALVIFGAFLGGLYLTYKRISLKREQKFILISLLAIPTIILLLERTHARPEIFSHLFFVLLLLIFYSRKKYLLFFVPLIMLVWVNTHIYFILGFLIIGAYFIESAFVERWSARTKQLLGVGVASLAVIFLNPDGLQGLLYPLTVFKNYGYTIVENQTPFFLIPFNYHHTTIATLFVMIFVLVISFAINWKKIRIADVIMSIGLVYLSLSAMRHAFVFAIGVLPILAYNISSFIGAIPRDFFEQWDINVKAFFRGVVVVGVIVFLFFAGTTAKSMSVAAPEYVDGAVNFVLENDIQGNMFNNFDIGGYLIYRLYPDRKVFVDNRPEAYPAEFFEKVYKPMQESPDVWREMVKRYDIQYVIFGTTDQTPWGQNFIQMIAVEPGWSVVYFDSTSFVALRNDVAEYKKIFLKYGFKI